MQIAIDCTLLHGSIQQYGAVFDAVAARHPGVEWSLFYRADPEEHHIDCDATSVVETRVATPANALALGLEGLCAERYSAFVALGGGQELVATAHLHLPEITRSEAFAFAAWVPTLLPGRQQLILDVGAVLEPTPRYLMQCAAFGVAAWQMRHGLAIPRLGLLNVGTEPSRGSTLLRAVFKELQENAWGAAFIGNVEPAHLLQGVADITLTGGVVGSILLKTMEALWPLQPSPVHVLQLLGSEHSVFSLPATVTPEGLSNALLHVLKIMHERRSAQERITASFT